MNEKFIQLVYTIADQKPLLGEMLFAPTATRELDVTFVSACLETFERFRDAENAVKHNIAFELIRALDCIRRSENAQWRN